MDLSQYKGKTISQLNFSDFDKVLTGVIWIVKDKNWNFLMLLEKNNKSWKKQGQWSFLMEESQEWENNIDTIKRGIKEELGVENIEDKQIEFKNLIIPFLIVDSKNSNLILAKWAIFEIVLDDKQVEKALLEKNNEIGEVKLFTKDLLQKLNLRPGVKEVLNYQKTVVFLQDGTYAKV